MEFFLVYVEQDSCDSGCANDVSESRVFCSAETARIHYDQQRRYHTDCIQLFRCEFIDDILTPVELLDQCGQRIQYFGIRLETK